MVRDGRQTILLKLGKRAQYARLEAPSVPLFVINAHQAFKNHERGSPTVSKARKSPKILAWFVPCPLAARPAAVLISFVWLRKVPHCVVVVAAQRKQGGA